MNSANLPRSAAFVFLFATAAILFAQYGPSAPVVHISAGTLRGAMQGNIAVFKGVPFAAPPLGDLRWRPPQPPTPWKGERDANKPGSPCMQSVEGLGPFIQPMAAAYGARYTILPVSASEDCLYLNVWVPRWPPQDKSPVMVWLHGGSNTAGSGAQGTYDAASLAAHGVIVVTINYRLCIFGFFSHPELTAESPHHSSGDYGLLDQLAALEWVRDNIGQFGGDPSNVTLFGESAGSIDAGVLIASPLSANLFHRAILESGPPFGLGASQSLRDAEAAGAALANAAPRTAATPLASLRRMSAPDLLKFSNAHGPYLTSGPIDGWIFPRSPANAFASGAAQKVDLIVGINGRELSAFRLMAAAVAKQASKPKPNNPGASSLSSLTDGMHLLYGDWTDAALASYLGEAIAHRDAALDRATNDIVLACPVTALADLTSSAGDRTYIYKFDRTIPGKGQVTLGAFHGLEVPYVFNAFHNESWQWLPFADADNRLSNTMETYWTNFAKTGNPNGPGVPSWPAWNSGGEGYMEFTAQAEAQARRGFSPPFCYLTADRVRTALSGTK